MKNKLPHYNFWILFQTKCKFFSHSKIKFLFSYALVLFINLSAVTAAIFILAKLSATLKSECVNTLEFLLLLERQWRDNNSGIKEHHLVCNHSSVFDDFSILASSNNVTSMESLLINKDHPPLNKNRHSLPLELFDNWGI